MTSEEREDRIYELLDNLLYGEKLLEQGAISKQELDIQSKDITKELKKLGYRF